MSNNISYFKTTAESMGYCISDIPWIGYIEEEDAIIWSKEYGMLQYGKLVPGTVVVLRGSMNEGESWDDKWLATHQVVLTVNDGHATCAITIEASSEPYEFKIVENGTWYTNEGYEVTGSDTFEVIDTGGYDNNIKIYAVTTGLYIFDWDIESNLLSIQYPSGEPKTVLFVNDNHWEDIYAYVWNSATDSEHTAWPGIPVTELLSDIDYSYDVYAVRDIGGHYDRIIFNSNEYQSAEYIINDGSFYYSGDKEASDLTNDGFEYSLIGGCGLCGESWTATETSAMILNDGILTWSNPRAFLCTTHQTEYSILRNGSADWSIGATKYTVPMVSIQGWYKIDISVNLKTKESEVNVEFIEEDMRTITYNLVGSFNEWAEPITMSRDASGETILSTIEITEAPSIIEFCITSEYDEWIKGTRLNRTDCTDQTSVSSEHNSILIADAVGSYTITYNPTAHTMSCTFPETPDTSLVLVNIDGHYDTIIAERIDDDYVCTIPGVTNSELCITNIGTGGKYYLQSSFGTAEKGTSVVLTTENVGSTVSTPYASNLIISKDFTYCSIDWDNLTVYLQPNSNWRDAGARFAAYFFGNGETWSDVLDNNGDGIYEVEVPEGYPSMIFCRMDPGTTDNNWDNKWNQSADLAIPTGNNVLCVIPDGDWDNTGYWTSL